MFTIKTKLSIQAQDNNIRNVAYIDFSGQDEIYQPLTHEIYPY